MRVVRFRTHWRQYNPNEEAGFADAEAASLVRDGLAEDRGPVRVFSVRIHGQY